MSNLQLVLIYFYLGVAGAIRKSGLWYFEDLVAALGGVAGVVGI